MFCPLPGFIVTETPQSGSSLAQSPSFNSSLEFGWVIFNAEGKGWVIIEDHLELNRRDRRLAPLPSWLILKIPLRIPPNP